MVAGDGSVGDFDEDVESVAAAEFAAPVVGAADEVGGAQVVFVVERFGVVIEGAESDVQVGAFDFDHFGVAGCLAHDEADAGVAACE